jgi:hypothetical protein
MRPDNETELGQEVRRTVYRHAGRLTGATRSRDRRLVALVAERHPGAVEAFGEAPITALLREPAPGRCAWDSAGDPLPTPTDGLRALLGQPCVRCRAAFEAAEVARRERALRAAGQRRPTAPVPTAATRKPPAPWYRSRRVQPGSRW